MPTLTSEILSDVRFTDILSKAKMPTRKEELYIEGYYDGAMDVFNAIMKYLKEKESSL